jgi:hypothetical protein
MPKPSSLLPGYTWEPDTARYRGADGRFVARTRITDLLGDAITQNERAMLRTVTAYHEGGLDARAWIADQTLALKREYLQNAALAAGGWDRLTARDYGRIGGKLRAEYARIANLGEQIAAGEVTLPQALNRVHMEQGGARSIYYQTERDHLPAAERGKVYIERRALGASEHCPSCFVGGTLVLCKDGLKSIEQVQIGDQVATLDGWHTVTETFSHSSNDLWLVETGAESVVCTGNHPFMLANGKWADARDLRAGQQVVTLQCGADIINGQIAFPNALDDIAASREVGGLRVVTFLLSTLLRAQRLESRVSMPIIAVNLKNDGADTEVAEKLVTNQILRFIDHAKGVKHFLDSLFSLTAAVLLAYKATLEKITHEFLSAFHASFLYGLTLFGGVFSASVCSAGPAMHKLGIGLGCERNAKGMRSVENLGKRIVHKLGAFLRSAVRIVHSNNGVFFWRPVMVAPALAATPRMIVFGNRAPACSADVRGPLWATGGALVNLAQFDSPASAEVMRFAAMPTKRGGRFCSAADALHGESSPMVYNLEVEHAHHYTANGFVVHNCIEYYEQGWQPEGTLPVPGEGSECLSNCQCEMLRKQVPASEESDWIGTKD